jgi:hypothetical protein
VLRENSTIGNKVQPGPSAPQKNKTPLMENAKMRLLLLICSLLLLLSPASQAREIWQGTLSERMFKAFLQIYQQDPSAMARFAGALRNISTQQMNESMDYLGVTHFTYLHPMTIYGYNLPHLKGTQNNRLSLMATRHNTMIPIPFQIDEFDQNGLIWIKGYNNARPEGQPGVWDDFDQLVFMYRDAGTSRYNPAVNGSVAGHIIKEIELDSPRDPPRWVYLVEDNPERSDAHYVTTDLKDGAVDSTLFSFKYDPSNLLDIESITPKAGPHYGQNVFNGLQVHLSTGILNRHLRLGLDKNNIHVNPIAVKDGPIRNIMLVKARIWYFGLPTFLDQNLMVDFYEQGIVIPTRIAIDSIRSLKFLALFLREPKGRITINFRNLDGARLTFDTVYDHKQLGFVDGKMDAFEKRMDSTRLAGNWLFLDSNQGWQMFFSNHIPVVPDGLANDFLNGVDMHMVYEDTKVPAADGKTDGTSLTLGFTAAGLPHTAIDMLAALPNLDFKHMHRLGEVIMAMSDAAKKGKLRELDSIINTRMGQLMQAGTITSTAQMADAFIRDLNRLHFIGIDRDVLDKLIRDSLLDTVKVPNQIDNNLVLEKMLALAKERGINLLDLRYAAMNNAFWFPDWVGEGGPTDFAWQVNNPPTSKINDYHLAASPADDPTQAKLSPTSLAPAVP